MFSTRRFKAQKLRRLKELFLPFVLAFLFATAASAQNSNSIFQNAGSAYSADVSQLESDSVQAFLLAHDLPGTDAPLLYQYGRRDLRDELRAWIFLSLQAILAKPAASRSPHEQNVYSWFQHLVYENELGAYTAAVAEYNRFLKNSCQFALDPVIAQTYHFTFNSGPYCYPISSYFSTPPVPSAGYFLAVGQNSTYNAAIAGYPNSAAILAETSSLNQLLLGVAVLPAVAAASVSGPLYAAAVIAPYAFYAFDFTIVGGSGSIAAATGAEIAVAAAGTAAGVGAIVAVGAAIGVEAVLQLVQQDQNNTAIQAMLTTYTSLVSHCDYVPLDQFVKDSSGLGKYKLLSTFLATTLPDVPSISPLPTRTEGADPIWGLPSQTPVDSISYTDWQGSLWSASLFGNYIVRKQLSCGSAVPAGSCQLTDSFGVTLQIATDGGACVSTNSCGNTVFTTASRVGPSWFIANQPNSGQSVLCPAGASGLSPASSSLDTCNAFVSSSLTFKPSLSQPLESVAVIAPPVFATSGSATFIEGIPQSIVLAAQVSNAAFASQTLSYKFSGLLPHNFTSKSDPSGVTLTYDGALNPNLPGTYNLTASAQFGGSAYVKTLSPFAVNVKAGDSIQVRSNILSANVGDTVDYQISAPGGANPSFQLLGLALPPGLRFTQDANSQSADISGIPTSPGMGSGTIRTNYGATEPLTLNVTYRQSPAFTSPDKWTFTGNTANRFRILTAPAAPNHNGPSSPPTILASPTPFPQGFVADVATLANAARPFTAAPWLHFVNRNDGTADLSGTPPSGSAPVIYLASVVPNSLPSFQTLTIVSSDQPVITGPVVIVTPQPLPVSPSTPTVVTVPLPVSSSIALTFPQFATLQNSGLTVTTDGNGNITLLSLTGGLFPLQSFLASTSGCVTTSSQSASKFAIGKSHLSFAQPQLSSTSTDGSGLIPFQTFYVEVDQAPSITSAPSTYFSLGLSNKFSLTTSGFPASLPAPNSTSSARAMRVTVSGTLPAGITFTDLSPAALPTGVGVLSGTPSQSGSFPLTVTANNGVGTPAIQQFTLVVTKPGDVNSDGVIDCADVAIVKAAFGTYQGQSRFDPRADLNHDFKVDVLDLAFVSTKLPVGTRCQ